MFEQLTKTASEWEIDLEEVYTMEKENWKKYIEVKSNGKKIKKDMINKTTHYKEITEMEEITPGQPKIYLQENRKIAIPRARTNTLDHAPRKPEWKIPFRCKFCLKKDQSSKHYIMECETTKHILKIQKKEKSTG